MKSYSAKRKYQKKRRTTMKKSMGGKSVNRINTHKQNRKQNLKYKYNSKKRQYGGRVDQNMYNSIYSRKGGKSKNKNNTKKLRVGGIFGFRDRGIASGIASATKSVAMPLASATKRVVNYARNVDLDYQHNTELTRIYEDITIRIKGIQNMSMVKPGFFRGSTTTPKDLIFKKYIPFFKNVVTQFSTYLKSEDIKRQSLKGSIGSDPNLYTLKQIKNLKKNTSIDTFNYVYYMRNINIDAIDYPDDTSNFEVDLKTYIKQSVELSSQITEIIKYIEGTKMNITTYRLFEAIKIYQAILKDLNKYITDKNIADNNLADERLNIKKYLEQYKYLLISGKLHEHVNKENYSEFGIKLGTFNVDNDSNEFNNATIITNQDNDCLNLAILKVPNYNDNCYYCSVDDIYNLYGVEFITQNSIQSLDNKNLHFEYSKEIKTSERIYFINDINHGDVKIEYQDAELTSNNKSKNNGNSTSGDCLSGDFFEMSNLGKLKKITETYKYENETRDLFKFKKYVVKYQLTYEFENATIIFPEKSSDKINDTNRYNMLFFVVSPNDEPTLQNIENVKDDLNMYSILYNTSNIEYKYGKYNNIENHAALKIKISSTNVIRRDEKVDEANKQSEDNKNKLEKDLKDRDFKIRGSTLYSEYRDAVNSQESDEKLKDLREMYDPIFIPYKNLDPESVNQKVSLLDPITKKIYNLLKSRGNVSVTSDNRVYDPEILKKFLENNYVFNTQFIINMLGKSEISINTNSYTKENIGINVVPDNINDNIVKKNYYNFYGNDNNKYIKIKDKYYNLNSPNTGITHMQLQNLLRSTSNINTTNKFLNISLYLSPSIDYMFSNQIYFLFSKASGEEFEIIFYMKRNKNMIGGGESVEFNVLSPKGAEIKYENNNEVKIKLNGIEKIYDITGSNTHEGISTYLYSTTKNIYTDFSPVYVKDITLQVTKDLINYKGETNIIEPEINLNEIYLINNGKYYSVTSPENAKDSINSEDISIPVIKIKDTGNIEKNKIYIIVSYDKSTIIPFYKKDDDDFKLLKHDIMFNSSSVNLSDKKIEVTGDDTLKINGPDGKDIYFNLESNEEDSLYSIDLKPELIKEYYMNNDSKFYYINKFYKGNRDVLHEKEEDQKENIKILIKKKYYETLKIYNDFDEFYNDKRKVFNRYGKIEYFDTRYNKAKEVKTKLDTLNTDCNNAFADSNISLDDLNKLNNNAIDINTEMEELVGADAMQKFLNNYKSRIYSPLQYTTSQPQTSQTQVVSTGDNNNIPILSHDSSASLNSIDGNDSIISSAVLHK